MIYQNGFSPTLLPNHPKIKEQNLWVGFGAQDDPIPMNGLTVLAPLIIGF
jgi:hypothetical protein